MRGPRWYLSAVRRHAWSLAARSPWAPVTAEELAGEFWCNICRWSGPTFQHLDHCEATLCPRCASSARDRFLVWCLSSRTPPSEGARLLETSPRGSKVYLRAMRRWFDYTASDYDEKAHAGTVRLDLQDIDLPDGAQDIVLSAHVLEHVPDTGRALSELYRILRPGGRLVLQVPIQQAVTAPPTEPEYHDDDTLVHWRFGFDFGEQVRAAGFDAALLTTESFRDAVAEGATMWPGWDGVPGGFDFDVVGLLTGADADELTPVVDRAAEHRLGLFHGYMFLVWEAIRP